MHTFAEDDRAAWNEFLVAYSQGNIDDAPRPDNIPNLDRYLEELGGWLAAPLRRDEQDRVKAFDRYSEDILQAYKDVGSDLKLDTYTRLAAALCDAPISLLNLLDSNTQWVTSEYGLKKWRHTTLPRSHTFCAHTILRRTREVFIVADARNDWRFAKMPMVCEEPFIRYYMGAPLTTSDGQNIGALCVMDPEIKRAEPSEKQKAGLIDLADTLMRELDLRADRLVARKAKEVFLSSISHELRSPLHGMLAYTELMIDDGHLTPFQELCSKTIQNCGRSLCDVIEQVLCISGGPDNGGKIEQVNLPSFLEEVIDATWAGKSKSKAKSADFEVTIDVDMTHLRHLFRFNRGEIGRIIMNLFGNAVKYTDHGYLNVKLYAGHPAFHQDGRRLQHVTFVFADSGKGISKDFLPKLFLPFVQQDHKSEGFGLGMSLVKQLVDKNHGTIDVESEVNVGTKITVTILLETVKAPELTPSASAVDDFKSLRGEAFYVCDTSENPLLKTNLIKTCTHTFNMLLVDLHEANVVIVLEESSLEKLRKEIVDKAIVVFAPSDVLTPRNTDHLQQPVGPSKLGRALLMAITLQDQKLYQARRSSIVHLDPISPPTSCAIKDFDPLSRPLSMVEESTASRADLSDSIDSSSATSAGTMQQDFDNFTFGRPQIESRKNASTTDSELKPKPKPHCLCVDDNQINLQIMAALLSKLDVSFETANHGREALALITKPDKRFDIIFMDVKMPIMDGIEASRLIREHERLLDLHPAIIVALTGCGPEEESAACKAGANHFMKKPVSMKQLTFFLDQFQARH